VPTPTHSKIPSRLILNYPGGFAWPAADDRFGRYLLCDYGPDRALTLGVVDDFGNLVRVPSVGVVSPSPTTGMLA
jgi:hypothetical protein